MDLENAYRLTASEVAAAINVKKQLTVEQYANSLLAHIRSRDSAVKAWAYLDPDLVLSQARELDQVPMEKRGPLHGVAVGVKDIIYTKGAKASREELKFILISLFRHAYATQFTGLLRQLPSCRRWIYSDAAACRRFDFR